MCNTVCSIDQGITGWKCSSDSETEEAANSWSYPQKGRHNLPAPSPTTDVPFTTIAFLLHRRRRTTTTVPSPFTFSWQAYLLGCWQISRRCQQWWFISGVQDRAIYQIVRLNCQWENSSESGPKLQIPFSLKLILRLRFGFDFIHF